MLQYLHLEPRFNPVLYPRCAGLIRNRDLNGPVQQLIGIEAVIYLLVFQQAVRVNTRAGNVKVPAHQWIVARYIKTKLLRRVARKLS